MLTGQTRLIGSWRGEWPLVIVISPYSFAVTQLGTRLALTSISLKDFPYFSSTSNNSEHAWYILHTWRFMILLSLFLFFHSILDPRSSILDLRSSILDPWSSILDPRSWFSRKPMQWLQTRIVFQQTNTHEIRLSKSTERIRSKNISFERLFKAQDS